MGGTEGIPLLSNDGAFGERQGMGRGLGERWLDVWELRLSGDIYLEEIFTWHSIVRPD